VEPKKVRDPKIKGYIEKRWANLYLSSDKAGTFVQDRQAARLIKSRSLAVKIHREFKNSPSGPGEFYSIEEKVYYAKA